MNKSTHASIYFEECEKYLYAHLTGKDSFEARLHCWEKISQTLKQRGMTRMLIHECLSGSINEVEMYDIIKTLDNADLSELRIAFFDENPEDHEINGFGQRIANHRGINLKIFSSLEEARRWITQG